MSDDNESNEILNEFLVESYEGLDQLDRDLIELESRGSSPELIGRVFRCVHTIKGTCGFLGFGTLESVAHVGENLLSKVRDGAIGISPELTSTLLSMIDAVRGMLNDIEAEGKERDTDHSALIARLTALTDGTATETLVARPDVAMSVGQSHTPARRIGDILVEQGHVNEGDVAAAMQEQESGVEARVGEILVARGVTSASSVKEALDTQQDARASHVADSSIRVDVSLLDRLMNLVGELVLARNQILQCTASNADSALVGTTQRLNLITSELQEGVMKTRMQRTIRCQI